MIKEAVLLHEKSSVDYLMTYSTLLTDYDDQLLQLQEACAQQLNTFPSRMHQSGQVILRRSAGPWHKVNWVQPFVLGLDWFIPQPSLEKIALAHALIEAQAHIHKIATQGNGRFTQDLLPLGSLMYTRAVRQYQQTFAPTAQFWRLLEGYHLEWAEALLRVHERQRQWGEVRRYNQEEILRMGGVGALSKIGCSAVALLAGKQRILMPLSSVMDQLHVTIQLVDGIVHWRRDLQQRQATYFLTETALALNAQEMGDLQRPNLEEFLTTCNLPAKVTGRALEHLKAAQRVAARLDTPGLVSYLKELESFFRQIPHWMEHTSSGAHALLTAASHLPLF